jgi:hypothetical protein
MKIGRLVQIHIGKIFQNCDDNELINLMDKQYSKDAFDINYPFCAEQENIPHKRYWRDIYVVRGKTLRVCSQWVEKSRDRFCHYIISNNLADPDTLSALNNLPEPSRQPSSQTATTANQTLPSCPDPLPDDIALGIKQLATLWARHADRPRIDSAILASWDKLITAWIDDKQLPLLIRKDGNSHMRGTESCHQSGRSLVRADNSPAWWSYALAYSGECPSIPDIHRFLDRDEIPIAFTLKAEEKAHSKYKCTSNKILNPNNPNKLRWKVCHRHKIGINLRGSIEKMPIANLETHFRRFISPSNLFLVPGILGGLGELQQFIDAIGHEA